MIVGKTIKERLEEIEIKIKILIENSPQVTKDAIANGQMTTAKEDTNNQDEVITQPSNFKPIIKEDSFRHSEIKNMIDKDYALENEGVKTNEN